MIQSFGSFRTNDHAIDIPPKPGEVVRVRSRRYLVEEVEPRDDSELLREFAADFGAQWPWPKRPEVYYDPRTISANQAQRATWHAKCVLVDDDLAFVTSANFTEWAQQRNVEAGVVLRNRHFAGQLRQQFEGLIQSKQVHRWPGF